MKHIKLISVLLLIAMLFTACSFSKGEGESGEGKAPGADNQNTNAEKISYETPFDKEAGLYNATTGDLKYSWEELLAKKYITVKETVITASIDYIRGELYIPNYISSIKSKAFSACTGLTGVYMGNGIITVGSSSFSGCTGLKTVVFSANITNISSKAFANCTKFRSITIPDSVTNIGASAFSGCTGLLRVTIGNGATNISKSAFSGCTGLNEVTLGKNITCVGSKAFSNCEALVCVNFKGTKAEWYAMNRSSGNGTLESAIIKTTDYPNGIHEPQSDTSLPA